MLLVDILSAMFNVLLHFFNTYTKTAFLSRAYLTTNSLLCAAPVKPYFDIRSEDDLLLC